MTTTFTCFPKLPSELHWMIWERAVADLPHLDIQRFTAGVACIKGNAKKNKTKGNTNKKNKPHHLICFTPHADLIRLTAAHRGLLAGCYDSRKAAKKHTSWPLLHINYLTTDANGDQVPKQGLVPFNRAGRFCVSGLCLAIITAQGAMERERPRGSGMLNFIWDRDNIDQLQLQGLDVSPVENLTVALEPAVPQYVATSYMNGWGNQFFEHIASRMPNLRTVSLIGEGALNRRHSIDQADFDLIHRRVAVNPNHGSGNGQSADWDWLWAN